MQFEKKMIGAGITMGYFIHNGSMDFEELNSISSTSIIVWVMHPKTHPSRSRKTDIS